MPMLSFGTWRSSPGKTKEAVFIAIQHGFRSIDTANDYGNEKEVGEALTKAFNEKIISRKDLFIQCKLWNSNHKAEYVKSDLLATL